jgi:hypothetical protein
MTNDHLDAFNLYVKCFEKIFICLNLWVKSSCIKTRPNGRMNLPPGKVDTKADAKH